MRQVSASKTDSLNYKMSHATTACDLACAMGNLFGGLKSERPGNEVTQLPHNLHFSLPSLLECLQIFSIKPFVCEQKLL